MPVAQSPAHYINRSKGCPFITFNLPSFVIQVVFTKSTHLRHHPVYMFTRKKTAIRAHLIMKWVRSEENEAKKNHFKAEVRNCEIVKCRYKEMMILAPEERKVVKLERTRSSQFKNLKKRQDLKFLISHNPRQYKAV
jgi:hypothetical protein